MKSQISAIRSLVWKEWRQQRWVFLILTCLPAVLTLAAPARYWCVSLGLWWGGVVALGTNTFAGEREGGSERFLIHLPISLASIFRTKFGISLGLSLAALLFLLLCTFSRATGGWQTSLVASELLTSLIEELAETAPSQLLVTIVRIIAGVTSVTIGCLMASAWAASLCSRTVTAFVLSIPLAGLASTGVLFLLVHTGSMFPHGTAAQALLPAATVCLLPLPSLGLAARAWRRRQSSALWTTVMALAVPGSVVAGYTCLCLGALACSCWLVDPQDYFAEADTGPPGRRVKVLPSPSGRHVLLNCYRKAGTIHESRIALLDTDSQECRWLDGPFGCSHAGPWAPDGVRLLAWDKQGIFSCDTAVSFLDFCLPGRPSRILYGHPTTRIVDASTGRSTPASAPPDARMNMPEWLDDDTFYYGRWSGENVGIVFTDTALSRVTVVPRPIEPSREGGEQCKTEGWWRTNRAWSYRSWMHTRRGVFGSVHVHSRRHAEDGLESSSMFTERYHPGLLEPERVVLTHTWGRGPRPVMVSDDGEWVLVAGKNAPGTCHVPVYVASLTDRAVREIAPPVPVVSFPQPRFRPGRSDVVLCLADGTVAVYHIGNRTCDVHTLHRTASGQTVPTSPIHGMRLSPSGQFLALWCPLDGETWGIPILNLEDGGERCVAEQQAKSGLEVHWLDNDRILLQSDRGLWTINREDGKQVQLLP